MRGTDRREQTPCGGGWTVAVFPWAFKWVCATPWDNTSRLDEKTGWFHRFDRLTGGTQAMFIQFHPFLGACHELSLISGCFYGPSFWWTLGRSQVSAIWSAEHQLNDSFGTFNSWVSCVRTHVDLQVRNAPKRGNSTQLKVSWVLAGHRPQSLTSLSEPENNESFKPSKHVLERQRKWHQHAKEVQCHLNQRNWHQQASEGLGKSCCGPLATVRNGETAPSWRFHGS